MRITLALGLAGLLIGCGAGPTYTSRVPTFPLEALQGPHARRVKIYLNALIGKLFTVGTLMNEKGFEAVFLALGVLAAYSYSLYATVTSGEVYFDTAAMIVTLILLGRLFEGSARNRSMTGIDKLLKLAPDTANLVEGDSVRSVARL